jgi:hypothetical protein
MTNGFIPNSLSPRKPVALVLTQRGIIDRLQLFMGDSRRRLNCKLGPEEHDQSVLVTEHFNSYFCLLAALVSRWTGSTESVSPVASSREDTPKPDERDYIQTPVPDRNLGEGSSDSDEVAFQQDHLAEVRASFSSCHVTIIWVTEYVIEVSLVSQQRIVWYHISRGTHI